MMPPGPERDALRAALAARGTEMSPGFRRRLAGTLARGRPRQARMSVVPVVAAAVLAAATISVLLGPRLVGPRDSGSTGASSARTASATRTESPRVWVGPVQVDADPATGSVVWALYPDDARLYRSTDGGSRWESRPLPQVGVTGPREIGFVDAGRGWALFPGSPATQCTEDEPILWRTADGGGAWVRVAAAGLSPRQCKEKLSFVDASHGFLDAWDQNHPPVIYRTTDAGSSWQASAPLPDPPGETSRGGGFTMRAGRVRRFGDTLLAPAYGFGKRYVYASTDGGATWAYRATVPGPTQLEVSFIDQRTWWASGGAPADSLRTGDAGTTWARPPNLDELGAVGAYEVVFAGSPIGYAVGLGRWARSDDGGLTWRALDAP